MIFVTVGTHEQQFNRLIMYMDDLKRHGLISDEVVIQIGYSTYEPQYCKWEKLYSYNEMMSLVKAARIVITHGGPSSFIMPLQYGKMPIVVPRKLEFGEHVNNHQLEFANAYNQKNGAILVVEQIEDLKEILRNYDFLTCQNSNENISNNNMFINKLIAITEELMTREG